MKRKTYLSALLAKKRQSIGYPIAIDNRIMPLDIVEDTDIAISLLAGTDSTDLATIQDQTHTITIKLPIIEYAGLLTYEVEANETDSWTVTAKRSLDSTNGIDGAWSDLPVTAMWQNPYPKHLQKIDIPAIAQIAWYQFTFTNTDYLSQPIRNIGLRKLDANGYNDYWIIFGASIMDGSMIYDALWTKANSTYGRDPMIFNRAYSGKNISYILTNLAQLISDHPASRFFFMHIGGNDVSNNRPYEDQTTQYLTDLEDDFRLLVNNLVSTNRVPIITNLTFRAYVNDPENSIPGTYSGGFEQYGSKPFNDDIINPIIAELTPQFYDFNNNKSLIDFYTYVLNDQSYLSSDGVHYVADGKDFLQNHFRDTAMRIIYDNTKPTSLVPTTYNTPDEDADYYISIAELSELQADIDIAQPWITALNDWPRDYDSAAIQVFQDRLDAIHPMSLTDYLIDLGSATLAATGNWNNLTQQTVGGTVTSLISSTGVESSKNLIVDSPFESIDATGGLDYDTWPTNACRDCFLVRGHIATDAVLRFTGLDVGKVYDVFVYSSQTGITNRSLDVTIGGVTKSQDAAENSTELITFSDIVPNASGEIILNINTSDNYAYCNAILLREKS